MSIHLSSHITHNIYYHLQKNHSVYVCVYLSWNNLFYYYYVINASLDLFPKAKEIKAKINVVVVVQSRSCVQFFAAPWAIACQAPLSFTVSQSLLRFMYIELVMLSNHLILCCPPFSFCVQSFPASGSFPMTPKYWSFSFSICPSSEGLSPEAKERKTNKQTKKTNETL